MFRSKCFRRCFPANYRYARESRFFRPALTRLEDRLLLSVSLNLEVSISPCRRPAQT
jgi:hypothetical protein